MPAAHSSSASIDAVGDELPTTTQLHITAALMTHGGLLGSTQHSSPVETTALL